MAKLIVDLSGQNGLLERHQGDLNSTSASPNLRYLGADGTFADGIFNPLKTYGYMSPSVNSFTTLTGIIKSPINSIQYDPTANVTYLSENGENILKLDGLNDLSVSNYLTVATTSDIKDMLLYEINDTKSLFYVVDSNSPVVYSFSSIRTGGTYVGFKTIDTTKGINALNNNLTVEGLSTGAIYYSVVSTAGESWATGLVRKIAQQINTLDFATYGTRHTNSVDVTGINMLLSREGGTGTGITMKVSICTAASASVAPFTSRGVWSDAVTNYVVNDTVTNGGFTWACLLNHNASTTSNEEPGVGSNWRQYWCRFGAPSSTVVASGTFALSSLSNLDNYSTTRTYIDFGGVVSLSLGTEYWILLEEVGSVMSGSTDKCAWLGTTNATGAYFRYARTFTTTGTLWRDSNPNGGDDLSVRHDDFDFTLVLNRSDDWSLSSAVGKFSTGTGKTSFLYNSDNALMYWFIDNSVHTIDGSLTGGTIGRVDSDVLRFASYIIPVDVAETRSRMYIAIQSSNRTTATDPRTYGASKAGVYIWDRRTQVVGASDYYPCPGAKEIKSVFTSSRGDVNAITVNNSGFSEIRGISGNQYAVLHTFEKDGYPTSRRSISQVDGVSIWLGANGIFYAYGSITNNEKAQLYKIGTMAAQASSSLITGPVLTGHTEATQPRLGVLFGYSDSTNLAEILVDSYASSNRDSSRVLDGASTGQIIGQTFVATSGAITRAQFFLQNTGGTSTGTMTAVLYATASGAPTTLLATSTAVNVNTLTTATYSLISFTFDGTYELAAGTTYFIGVNDSAITGATVQVGSDNSSPTHSGTGYRQISGAFFANADDTIFYVYTSVGGYLKKWYPNGDGTIDSVAQVAAQGDIYTKVYTLPSLATIKYMRLMMAPGVNSGTTTVANLKCYYNQSATAAWTKAITLDDIKKGWKNIEVNKNNINFVQFEIEYITNITLGVDDFKPMYIELEYADEGRINA